MKFQYNNPLNMDLLFALGRTGVALDSDIKQHLNLSKKSIASLIDAQLIEVERIFIQKQGMKSYYRLTRKGYQYVKVGLGLNFMYRTSSNQVLHDLKLCEYYCSLERDLRNTWITETEIHSQILSLPNKDHNVHGAIDGAYIENGKLIGVEVITRNYDSNEIQNKQAAADLMGCRRLIKLKL